MHTLRTYSGSYVNLGPEVYRIKSVSSELVRGDSRYASGTLVRPISGVDDSDQPGYHFNAEWLTICRVGAIQAEFVGFPRADLEYVCDIYNIDLFQRALYAWLYSLEQLGQ